LSIPPLLIFYFFITYSIDKQGNKWYFKSGEVNMPKIEIEQKRPLDATPERALAMFRAGVKQVEIAKLWHISAGRVSHLIARAKKREAKK